MKSRCLLIKFIESYAKVSFIIDDADLILQNAYSRKLPAPSIVSTLGNTDEHPQAGEHPKAGEHILTVS